MKVNEESLKAWEQEHIEILTSREMREWLHRRDMNASPQGDPRDNLKEIFREAATIKGNIFNLYEIEKIIDGEPWM